MPYINVIQIYLQKENYIFEIIYTNRSNMIYSL